MQRKEMEAACSTCGNEKRCKQGLCLGNLRKMDHLKNLGADRKMILKKFLQEMG